MPESFYPVTSTAHKLGKGGRAGPRSAPPLTCPPPGWRPPAPPGCAARPAPGSARLGRTPTPLAARSPAGGGGRPPCHRAPRVSRWPRGSSRCRREGGGGCGGSGARGAGRAEPGRALASTAFPVLGERAAFPHLPTSSPAGRRSASASNPNED